MVKTDELNVKTNGNCEVVNITDQVAAAVSKSKMTAGTVTVFNVGSTAGIAEFRGMGLEPFPFDQRWCALADRTVGRDVSGTLAAIYRPTTTT